MGVGQLNCRRKYIDMFSFLLKLVIVFASTSSTAFNPKVALLGERLVNNNFTICVTGVSNSGKTYFSNMITKYLYQKFRLNTIIVHQDYFFIPLDITPNEVVGFHADGNEKLYPRFEEALSYDWVGFWQYATNVINKERRTSIVIVEGSIILQAERAFHLCNKIVDITIDFETGLKRRQGRKDYVDDFMKKREYYEKITWAEHIRYMEVAEIVAKQTNNPIIHISDKSIMLAEERGSLEEFISDQLLD